MQLSLVLPNVYGSSFLKTDILPLDQLSFPLKTVVEDSGSEDFEYLPIDLNEVVRDDTNFKLKYVFIYLQISF